MATHSRFDAGSRTPRVGPRTEITASTPRSWAARNLSMMSARTGCTVVCLDVRSAAVPGKPADRLGVVRLGAVGGTLQLGDVELAHLQHRLHRTPGPTRVGVGEQLEQPPRHDLPGQTP